MYAPHWPGTAPTVKSSELRPSRVWIYLGSALIALGIIGGIIMLVTALIGLNGLAPKDTNTFQSEDSLTINLEEDEKRTIYLKNGSEVINEPDCTAESPTQTDIVIFEKYDNRSLNVNHWRALYDIEVPSNGEYTISCTGLNNVTYGVGRPMPGAMVVEFVLALVFPIVGVISGVIIIIITVIRRANFKKRLLQQRNAQYQQPPYPPQGQYGLPS